MTTESNPEGVLRRPRAQLSPTAAFRLRLHHRIRAFPPRRFGALAMACIVGLSTWSIVNAARSSQAQWGDVLGVVVATSDIGPGEALSTANTELRALPLALLPGRALTEDQLGRLASEFIGEGQIIVEGQVVADRHGLDRRSPDRSSRSITLPQPLAPPALIAGDTVDLIAVQAGTDQVRSFILATAEVAEVADEGITVIVDSSLAVEVFEALGSGSVEFARRTPQG